MLPKFCSCIAAAVVAMATAGTATRAQETDEVYNPFTVAKVGIRLSPTDTSLGCKAVLRDSATSAGPGKSRLQFGSYTNGWRHIDFPTASSAIPSTKVTVRFKHDGEEKSFSLTEANRVQSEVDARYVRLDAEGAHEKFKDIKGEMTVSIDGDPSEYRYNVGGMSPLLGALDACMRTYGPGAACSIAGPQTPRDIADKAGTHPVTISLAPEVTSLNLCNLHFHVTAEHKSPGFTAEAESEGGYLCNNRESLTAAERAVPNGEGCEAEPG